MRNTEVLFSGEKVEIGKPLKNNVRWKISAGGGGGGGEFEKQEEKRGGDVLGEER